MKKLFVFFFFILMIMSIPLFGRDIFAVLVGMSNYQFFPRLTSTRNDVVKMKEFLIGTLHVQPEFILTVVDKPYGVFYGKFKNFISNNKRYMTPDDIFIFYFAGHGDLYSGDPVLIFTDAPRDYKAGVLREKDIAADLLKDVPCTRMVILDACHQGEVRGLRTRLVIEPDVFIAASTKDNVANSRDMGVLTESLIKGFRPEFSDTNKDLVVDMKEAKRFIERYVYSETNGEQEPVIVIKKDIAFDYKDEYGFLQLDTTPPDAKIVLEESGLKLENGAKEPLRDGQYTIRVEKPGYETLEKAVAIRRGETTKVRMSLKRIRYPLRIMVLDNFANGIEGAKVSVTVDGKTEERRTDNRGMLSMGLKDLPATVKMTVSKGKLVKEKEMTVNSNNINDFMTVFLTKEYTGISEEKKKAVNLQKGILYILNPSMELVKVNGKEVGSAGVIKHEVDKSGEYVVANDTKGVNVNVEVGKVKVVDLSQQMNPDVFAAVYVENRLRSDIWVDGKYMGTDEEKTVKLAPGRHIFEFLKDGYRTKRVVEVLKPYDVRVMRVELERRCGVLRVELPEGFALYVDGKKVAESRTYQGKMIAGRYDISVRKGDAEIYKTTVEIADRVIREVSKEEIEEVYNRVQSEVSRFLPEKTAQLKLSLIKGNAKDVVKRVRELGRLTGDEIYGELADSVLKSDLDRLKTIANDERLKDLKRYIEIFVEKAITVSGYVKDASENAISGATISFSGGAAPTTTDANGHWSKKGLWGSVTITPSKTGHAFTPSSTTVSGSRDDVNFTGTYSISGYVKDASGNGISDVTISFSGGAIPTTTDANGHWSKKGLWGSVTITPSKTGYVFTPSSTTVTGSRDDVNFTGISQAGTFKWKYKTGGWVESSPAIGPDGTVYVGSNDDFLYAIRPDGTIKWEYETGDQVESSPAIGPDGTVYVGSNDDFLYAIRPDGTIKWEYETGCVGRSSPAIGPDGTVYVGSKDGYLYAIRPDGTIKWKYETGDQVKSSPAIGPDGTVYVGSRDSYLYAINPDGTIKWKYKTRYRVDSSPAIGKDGTVYVGSDDGYLYALNLDGTLKWGYGTEGRVYSSPAIGPDGTVYVGSDDDFLYALNPDGTIKWKYKTGGWVESSPAIGKDGTVYVGSWDSYLYALNPDGTIKWKYKTGDWVESSPAIGEDGTIYVGSEDNYLYAINGSSGGLADTPWPMFHHDVRHNEMAEKDREYEIKKLIDKNEPG